MLGTPGGATIHNDFPVGATGTCFGKPFCRSVRARREGDTARCEGAAPRGSATSLAFCCSGRLDAAVPRLYAVVLVIRDHPRKSAEWAPFALPLCGPLRPKRSSRALIRVSCWETATPEPL